MKIGFHHLSKMNVKIMDETAIIERVVIFVERERDSLSLASSRLKWNF